MTRASLLHILDHVSGISDAEVRELEQLAAAFPYCQTGHLLLAKAAHDRGSMLAGQRLRRAATYAADRELLRQLLEQPAAPGTPPVAVEPPEALASVSTAAETITAAIPAFYEQITPALEPSAATDAPEAPLLPTYSTAEMAETSLPTSGEPEATATEIVATDAEPQELPEAPEVATESAAEPALAAPAASAVLAASAAQATDELSEKATPIEAVAPEQPADAEPSAIEEAATPDEQPSIAPAETPELTVSSENEPREQTSLPGGAENAAETAAAPDTDVLPAVAPPIRPPAEAGISRFEFGLSQPELPVPSGYQLPGLDEDEEGDELPTLGNLPARPAPAVTAPFRTDKDLGYSLGAGSRLGYDLQPHDGYTLDLPLDAFFEPDALLLAHMRAHQPKPTASSLDLINQFLKAKPRIKSPVGVPLPATEQADLSVRSTSSAPALASESLAKIMVRQGKKDKAIEIYERLMERQPEKKAYFADQIQQLQQPSE